MIAPAPLVALAQTSQIPSINTFTASPGSISAGQGVTLSWDSSLAQSCSILRNESNGGLYMIANVSTNGNYTIYPSASSAYTLSCSGQDDGSGKDAPSAQKTVFISVTVATTLQTPTIVFNAYPSTIATGQSATLYWNTANAQRCVLQYGSSEENISLNGSKTVSPSQTTSYKIWCANDPGNGKDGPSAQKYVTVTVSATAPTCSLTTDKKSYKLGETITFSWTSQNATYGAWQQNTYGKDNLKMPGDKLSVSGSQMVTANVTGNPSATLLIYGYGGSNSCTATVSVTDSQTSSQSTNSNAANADIDTESYGSCLALNNGLRYRSRDIGTNGEVSSLQDFLQAKGYLNSEPTGFFGLLTLAAVRDFQRSALGFGYDTGFVGPMTRAKIKALTCQ